MITVTRETVEAKRERAIVDHHGKCAGAVALLGIGGLLAKTIWFSGVGTNRVPRPDFEGNTIVLGRQLFTNYLLPFEIVSVLLLVAMIGAILLSKKELK